MPFLCQFAKLVTWKSYYSLFEMKNTKSIWILHLSRSVGEGIASLSTKKCSSQKNAFIGLREADSFIYLEIGELIRSFFNSIIELWPKSEKLNVLRCRHILQLIFLNNSILEEQYLIIFLKIDNRECSGEFHLVFPQRHLASL